MQTPFSPFIASLPEADIPFDGVSGRLLAAPQGQVVFFDLAAGLRIPPHSHGAQWGVVVSGLLRLTIDGRTAELRAGDSYHIDDGEVHEALVLEDARVVDVFSEPDRYRVKA
ncbi:MAG: cupin domain-containing protein [Desulfovibrionaceae bacterium]|nr:cupin domain-containing protein [Desulfovibrionaceae bacterium]